MHVVSGVDRTQSYFPDITTNNDIYQYYVWLRKAVTVKERNIASLPVGVMRDGEWVKGHPITRIFETVNPNEDSSDLWGQWSTDMDLAGENYIEIVDGLNGSPVELWRRDPRDVEVIPDVSNPNYPLVAGYRIDGDFVPPENVISWKYYHPETPYRGLSVVGAVRRGITIDILAQAWVTMLLKKGARPDWAFIAPQGLTKDEREQIEFTIMEKFSGIGNTHKPVVLEDGITDIKTLSYPPDDVRWLAQRETSREEVGAILGVPDKIMGWGEDTYDTEVKLYAAMTAFWVLTLKPMIDKRDTGLNKFFTKIRKLLQPGETIVTDTSGVQYLQEELASRLEQAAKLFGLGYSLNQINERLGLNMPEVEWGDTGYLPSNLVPVGMLGNPQPGQATVGLSKSIYRRYKQLGDNAPAEADEYEADVTALIEAGSSGEITQEEFESSLEEITVAAMIAMFLRGSNKMEAQLTDEEIAIIAEHTGLATDSIINLAGDVYDGNFQSEDEGGKGWDSVARAALWAAFAWALFERAKLFRVGNGYLKWNITPGKKHCADCLRLNGQVHRQNEWRASGWWPKISSLACTGRRCGCYFTEAAGPSVGDF